MIDDLARLVICGPAETVEDQRVAATEEILGQFLGDETFPVHWDSEVEKDLFWVYDDLHCPHPLSPMYFDIGGWWLSCDHMFRRFGTPFAVDWIAKNVNGYLYTAAIPADPDLRVEATEYSSRYGARVPRDPDVRREDRRVPRRRPADLRPRVRRLVARPPAARDGAQLRLSSRRASTRPTRWTSRSSPACSRTRSTSTIATGRSTGCSTSPSSPRRSTCGRSWRRPAARSTSSCSAGSRTRPRTATGTRSRRSGR